MLESSEEELTDFIEEAQEEGDTSDVDDAPTGPSTVAPVLGISEPEELWQNLLERATFRATRGRMVQETQDHNSIHDVPPEFWILSIFVSTRYFAFYSFAHWLLKPGWEDIVVFHIGRCA